MTREEIMGLPPRELDALVAEHVMGIKGVTRETPGWERTEVNFGGFWYDVDYGDGIVDRVSVPRYSTDIAAAWAVIEKLGDLACPFGRGDGWVQLTRGDWADHSDGCDLAHCADWHGDDDRADPEPWSAHVHVGVITENLETPAHWSHGDRFCVYGPTPMVAICRAALLAMC